MALFSPNEAKLKQIELQNIIFGTNEKKLMVSPEFLKEMTVHYVSKRMKTINQMMEVIMATKSAQKFFSALDIIDESLGELIAIEKYHEFKKPVPSSFKQGFDSKRERYTEVMINRVWKDANLKANFDPVREEKRSPAKFAQVLDDLLEYKDRYSPSLMGHIERFYKSVYGYGFDGPEEEAAAEENTEDTEDMNDMNDMNEAENDGLFPEDDDMGFVEGIEGI